jgi:hypothetical protein
MPRKPSPAWTIDALRRRAVRDHAASERRASFVPIVHLGTPGEPHEVFAVVPEEPTDHALRTDVVAAMRQRALRRPGTGSGPARSAVQPLVWLTRPGDLEVQDVDMAWFAAARQAYAEAGAELHFALVCRFGWRDPATGASQTWVRSRAGA